MTRWPIPVAVLLIAVTSCSSDSPSSDQAIDERAAVVMPFDLTETTHTFEKSPTGGVQIVAAIDPSDVNQIALIRGHLRAEAANFRVGDYSDPAEIHGMDMPGLDKLQEGYRDITVEYIELSDGARLTYTAVKPTLIDAIHAWFDRQTMDHS